MGLVDVLRAWLGVADVEAEPSWALRHQPQPARAELDWTPDRVRRAFSSAEAGQLLEAADMWSAMRRDARIAGVMRTRTVGQASLPVRFEGPTRPCKHVASLWSRALPVSELARLLEHGLALGVGYGSIEWCPIGDSVYPALRVWDPRWLRLQHDEEGVPRWYTQTREGGDVEVTPGRGWVLFTPYGEAEPWRYGLWQSLAWPWLMKTFAIFDRQKHAEINGSPAWVGKTKGLSETQRRSFLRDLRNLGRNARIVLPPDCDIELLEATARTHEIYRDIIDWADSETSIAIAGQVVTTEGTQGFSEGEIYERILASLIRFTATELADCLHRQVVTPWTAFEFGEGKEAPIPIYQTEPPEVVRDIAASFQSLGQAIAALNSAFSASGLRIDARELVERFDIPTVRLRMSAEESAPDVAGDSAIPIQLAPTDIAAVVKANEARALMRLPPIAGGDTPITAFRAREVAPAEAELAEAAETDPVLEAAE